MVLPCPSVGVMDSDDGLEGIVVKIFGISRPAYETLFPEHVACL